MSSHCAALLLLLISSKSKHVNVLLLYEQILQTVRAPGQRQAAGIEVGQYGTRLSTTGPTFLSNNFIETEQKKDSF